MLPTIIGSPSVNIHLKDGASPTNIAKDLQTLAVTAILLKSIPNLTDEQIQFVLSNQKTIHHNFRTVLSL